MSTTKPGGAFIEGFVRRFATGRVSRSTIEFDRQMTRGLETRLLVALGFGAAFNALVPKLQLSFSWISIVAAFLCSTGIGVVFGYLPARQASFLDPLAALSRD